MPVILDTNVVSEMIGSTVDPNVDEWLSHQDPSELFLTTIVEALALWWLLRRRLTSLDAQSHSSDRGIVRSAAGSLLLSLLMAAALWLLLDASPAGGWLTAVTGILAGAMLFFGLDYVLGLSETRALLSPLLRKLLRLVKR